MAGTLHNCAIRPQRVALKDARREVELAIINDAIETYEAKRWPEGRVPGGKG